MKKKITSTDRVGRLIGKTTFHSTCHLLAPSSAAASRTDGGNVARTDDSR